MRFPSWLKSRGRRTHGRPTRKARRRLRLRIESLEDRVVPTADTLIPNITSVLPARLGKVNTSLLGGISSPAATRTRTPPPTSTSTRSR